MYSSSNNSKVSKRLSSGIVGVMIVSLSFACTVQAASGQSKSKHSAGTPRNAAEPLPNLTLPALDGRTWSLREHRGKIVLINFWATWCAPCREETPALVRLSNKHRADGLEVVGVSLDSGGTEVIEEFITEYEVPYTILLPVPGSALTRQQAIPMSLLVDREGRLAKKYVGAVSERIIEADIKKLLTAKRTRAQSEAQVGAQGGPQRKRVSDAVTIAGQLTPGEITAARGQGFKSVLNLRAPGERGLPPDEARQVEGAKLKYANVAVVKDELNDELAARVIEEMSAMPKPVLVHCATGARAGMLALLYATVREGLTADEALRRAEAEGFTFTADPKLKSFFTRYIETHRRKP